MKELVKVTRIENEFVVVVNNEGKESKRKYFELNNRIQKIVETKMAFNYKGYVYPLQFLISMIFNKYRVWHNCQIGKVSFNS